MKKLVDCKFAIKTRKIKIFPQHLLKDNSKNVKEFIIKTFEDEKLLKKNISEKNMDEFKMIYQMMKISDEKMKKIQVAKQERDEQINVDNDDEDEDFKGIDDFDSVEDFEKYLAGEIEAEKMIQGIDDIVDDNFKCDKVMQISDKASTYFTVEIKQEVPINKIIERIFLKTHKEDCVCKGTFYPNICNYNKYFVGLQSLFKYIDLNIYNCFSKLRFTDKSAMFNKSNNYVRLLDREAIEELQPTTKHGS